jgi:chromosome partitioning protein
MTRTIAVASQKGGVGKTSMVQNLGLELARLGSRVLLVDFDPQSNLTIGFGFDADAERLTVFDALQDPSKAKETILEVRPKLDLIPASLDLAAAELTFVNAITDRHAKLKNMLTQCDDYDIVLIDCPPSLGFFTVNGLSAATEVLIPLQCHVYPFKALDQLLPIVEEVQRVNPDLSLGGIALTMWDPRNNLTQAVEENVRTRFGKRVFKTQIPINVRVAEAPLDGLCVTELEASSKGAIAYAALAREVNRAKVRRTKQKAGVLA